MAEEFVSDPEQTVDGLPILKKHSSVTEDGLPILKKKVGTPASKSTLPPSNIGGQNDPNFLNLMNNDQQSYAPVINPVEKQRLQQEQAPVTDAHHISINRGKAFQQAKIQPPTEDKRKLIEDYLPNAPEWLKSADKWTDENVVKPVLNPIESFFMNRVYHPVNEGYNDVIVKPLAGATDVLDRAIDATYKGVTGEQTPEWLRKGGIFHNVSKEIQQGYEKREKASNIASETLEGLTGTLPLMASMFTGQGEATLATQAPQLFGKLAKTLAVTKGLTGFKDATEQGDDLTTSLGKATTEAIKGGIEGQFMDAQMLIGGALGKGVIGKLVEKGLFKGGKATEALLHALSVGTVFGGTSAGEDLLQGKEIDTHNALKQFGMGLAFEMIPTVKGINDEIKDTRDQKKVNDKALQEAAVATSASNMNAESAIRTLINTPTEQLKSIKDNVKGSYEDLYADSIEQGAKAYEAKDTAEKKTHYLNQLVLKTQGDVKMLAEKVKSDPLGIADAINSSEEIDATQKAELLSKIQELAPAETQEAPIIELPTGKSEPVIPQTEPVTTETPIANEQTVQPEGNEINPSVPIEQPTVEARVQETDSKTPDAKGEESTVEHFKLGDQDEFYHASPTKREGNLRTGSAPQFGEGVYFSTNKDLVINEFGKELTKVKLKVEKPLYTGTKEETKVQEKAAENWNKDNLTWDAENEYFVDKNGKETVPVEGGDIGERLPVKYFSDAAKEMGYDVIIDKGSETYDNEIVVLNPDKIVYEENIKPTTDAEPTVTTEKSEVTNPTGVKQPTEEVQQPEVKQPSVKENKEGVVNGDTKLQAEQSTLKAGDPLRTFAAKVREGKISKLGGFKSGSLFDTAWDGSLEVVATAIEGGAKLADAIESGLKHIRSTQWYKDLQDKKAFDDAYVPHMEKEYAKEQETAPKSETESKVESSNDLKSLAIDIPNGGEVKKYLSGETIERHEGDDLRNDQSYIRQELNPALEHGVKIIEQAKAEFGKDYVPKTLQFIEENGTVESKALMYVSLENELAARKLAEPENSLAISKLQDLVREKSQAYLRSNAIAINMGRLRKFAEVGYDINKVTDNFFSTAEREKKAKVEKSIQSTPDEINKQAEIKEADVNDDGDFDIKPKARKKIFGLNETQKKERDALAKEFRGQFNDVTRIATLLVNKKFLKYAKLEFLDTAGDFESFAHKMIDNVGAGIQEHLPELYKKFGGEDEVKLKPKTKPERTPEEKLSDAKDLVKNRIDDLFEQIQSKKRELKTREIDIEADAELKALQAEESALRRVRDKELPLDKKPVTDEQKAKSQIARLTDEIENIDKQIKQGEKDAIEEKKDPINDERVNKLKAEKNARLHILEAIDPNPKETVKKALIENGFGREITVTTKNGKEQRQIIDWKKLAGDEGSVVKIQEHVEEYLRKNGYSEGEILRMQDAFVKEYNDLRASVIEKSLNELQNRNKEVPAKDIKTSAKRLAELYNYGLFDKQPDTYDYLMNKALGLGDIGQEGFFKAKILAKSLSDLFRSTDENGNVINQSNLKHAESVINKKIENLLSDVAFKQASTPYKLATIAKEYVGLAQRSMLVSMSQLLENTSSGYIARAFNKIGFSLDNVDTKALRSSRTKLANNIFKDINLNAALDYGDVNSPFLNKSRTMELINNASDSKVYHALSTALLGRSFLEGADSMHKVALTEKFFTYSLIKVLRKKGMEKQEAINYVSEQLTGQSFKDALVASKEIIDKINTDAGKKIIPDNNESIHRFANDIVREALIGGNKLSLKEVEASFGAAYTAAGFELGHEANNLTSMMVSGLSEKIQGKLNKAVKEKDWSAATAYTGASTIATNVMNPFVGGGSNWVFLGLQKAGIPTLSTLYFNMKARRGIDVASEAGQKTLERDLTNQLLAKNANTRLVLGATLSLAAVALAKSTNADEDLNKWLKKNKWAKKYFNKISPPALSLLLAMINKEVGHYVATLLNVKDNAAFDEGKKVITAVQNASKGTTSGKKKALGAAGDLIGSRLSTPLIPWRLIRDTEDITRGLMGLPPIKKDFQTSGFWNGYFKGGLVEYMDARPKKD